MNVLLAALMVIVGLTGAGVILLVVLKLFTEEVESAWEYLIAVLVGVGLLVWPVAIQSSRQNVGQGSDPFHQLREIEDLGRFSLVDDETGERMDITVDARGVVMIGPARPAEDGPAPPEPDVPDDDAPGPASEADSELTEEARGEAEAPPE